MLAIRFSSNHEARTHIVILCSSRQLVTKEKRTNSTAIVSSGSRERIDLIDGDPSLRISRTLSCSGDIVCRTKLFATAGRMTKDVGSGLKVSLACA
ncbi:unnamed protein product [Nippostrongylus brasiliensis]|uniref:Uncharacterized protein n=1 Tax=Nippostrongylus brasiliensis TaxID=27835 RepID=A0A0N4YZ66_NIPBR|nr:unnamed protein product [Nippostrongylus brasiliensis]